MLVKNYMTENVNAITKDETILEAISFMNKNDRNSLIVIDDDDRPIGTLSSYTIIRAAIPSIFDNPVYSSFSQEGSFEKYAENLKNMTVKEIMHTDFHVLKENDSMIEAAAYSVKAGRRIMPVIDEAGKLLAIVTRTDVKKALFDAIEE